LEASGVEEERGRAGSRIFVCGVEHQRGSANCRVEVACSKALERKPSNCGIPLPRGEAKEGLLPFCRGEVGIAAVWRRYNRFGLWQKPKTDKREYNEKWWSCCFESNQVMHWVSFRFPAVLILRLQVWRRRRT